MYAPSINGILTGGSSVDLINGIFGAPTSDESSPLVVPPGPLATAAFESGMSAVEELKLLKTQVQDVSRVCQAVARGDLSQKITVPVQGVVMVHLKDVINTMVSLGCLSVVIVRDLTILLFSTRYILSYFSVNNSWFGVLGGQTRPIC